MEGNKVKYVLSAVAGLGVAYAVYKIWSYKTTIKVIHVNTESKSPLLSSTDMDRSGLDQGRSAPPERVPVSKASV